MRVVRRHGGLMVDARGVLRRNLERWKHEACLWRWLGHLWLQWVVGLVTRRRIMRPLLLLLSRVDSG